MYSVLILTLNEERNLPGCLASVANCDDIVVLDSGSTDRTAEIAQAVGARVFTRKFDNFAGQRNHAHRSIAFRHPWVFHLDADEKFTPELDAECRTHAGRTDLDGFFVAPKMYWRNRWVPHCTDFPAYQARYARALEFEFIEVGHGQREALHMRMGTMAASYLHDLSAGGTEEWLEKHRRYARAEALNHHATHVQLRPSELFSRERLVRRRALKRLSFMLPGRQLLRFVYQYILRRGFLDGPEGLELCRLLAQADGFASAELRRLRR